MQGRQIRKLMGTNKRCTGSFVVNYIFLLCVFSLDILYNNILNVIFTRDVLLVIFLLLIIGGFTLFKNADNKLYIPANTKYVTLTWCLVLISSLIPFLDGIQGYFETLLAQRSLLAMTFLLFLLKISPSEAEIIKVLRKLSIIIIIIGLLSIIWPYVFMDENQTKTYDAQIDTDRTDIINTGLGIIVLSLYFFYLCQKTIKDGSLANFTKVSVLFFYLIILQNRSTLLIALPVFLYTIFKMRSKYKSKMLLVIGGLGIFFLGSYVMTLLNNLADETQVQLASEGYNRWQAMDFFFLERNYSLVDILFGHGVPSAGSSYLKSLVEASEDRWAFISDIGLLGVFFYYGALFLCVLYIPFVFKVLLKGKYPFYLKAFSLWILMVPTIHYYNLPGSTAFVIYYLYMYLVIIYKRDLLYLQEEFE